MEEIKKENKNNIFKIIYAIFIIIIVILIGLICFMIYTDLTHKDYDKETEEKEVIEEKNEIEKETIISNEIYDISSLYNEYTNINYEEELDTKEYSLIENKLYYNEELVTITNELDIKKILFNDKLYILTNDNKLYIYNEELEQILSEYIIDNITLKNQIYNLNTDFESLIIVKIDNKDYVLQSDNTIKLYEEEINELFNDFVINDEENNMIVNINGEVLYNNETIKYNEEDISTLYVIINNDMYYFLDKDNLYSFKEGLTLIGKYNDIKLDNDTESILVILDNKEYTFNVESTDLVD